MTIKSGKVIQWRSAKNYLKSKRIVFAQLSSEIVHIKVTINVEQTCQGEPGVAGEKFLSLL